MIVDVGNAVCCITSIEVGSRRVARVSLNWVDINSEETISLRHVREKYRGAEGAPGCGVGNLGLGVGFVYMHANPVKRGLVEHPKDLPWSSWEFHWGKRSP